MFRQIGLPSIDSFTLLKTLLSIEGVKVLATDYAFIEDVFLELRYQFLTGGSTLLMNKNALLVNIAEEILVAARAQA